MKEVPLTVMFDQTRVVGKANVYEDGTVNMLITDDRVVSMISCEALRTVSLGFTLADPDPKLVEYFREQKPLRVISYGQCSSCGVNECASAPYNQSCVCCFHNHAFQGK